MKKKISNSRYMRDQTKLNKLTSIVLEDIENIYNFFDVESYKGTRVYFSTCFIHGGDNRSALNLYYDADYRVHYKCRTHLCENHFGTSLISMIRGGLSHLKYDWKVPGDQTVSFNETIDFLLKRYNLTFDELETSEPEFKTISRPKKPIKRKRVKGTIERDFFRQRIYMPSWYHVNRGYSKEILDKYDVGICKTRGKYFFNRSVVPVYDEDGRLIVGFTGRSIFEECEKCGNYHSPDSYKCFFCPKWKHSKNLEVERLLYNFSNAKEYIKKTSVAILVESPGNVWRLEEAGVHNSVAIFGTSLNIEQKMMLEECGISALILIMDSDENLAGQKAAEIIKEQCKDNDYEVRIIEPTKEDISEMTVDEVIDEILPCIKNIEKVNS